MTMIFDEAFILDAVGLPGLTDIARQAAGVANLTLSCLLYTSDVYKRQAQLVANCLWPARA